jgi:ceramide glucosyltransferase
MQGLAFLTIMLWILALAALGYQIQALRQLRLYFAHNQDVSAGVAGAAPVTLLKPLYGPEPQLAANLASFLRQNYAGPVQLLCGVGDADDGAIAAVKELQSRFPDAHITLTTGPRADGANGKMGNLTAMMPHAAHDILVLSDSDMVVPSDYLDCVIASLNQPDIGAVSCLYIGRGDAGFWSEIGAAAISTLMMPSMIMGLSTGMAQPCMGSTIALRRETLDKIGGFSRFADVLADDHAIGAAVHQLGLSIAIPTILLVHGGDEASFGALWRHHLRWAVTLRGIAGWAHVGSVVIHGLTLAVLTCVVSPTPGLLLLGLMLALRYAMLRMVTRIARRPIAPFSQVILADFIEFAVFLASLVTRKIDWRGHGLTIGDSGRIRVR